MQKRESVVTWLLIVLNLMVYALVALQGNPEDPLVLLKYGAKWAPAIFSGQWWRFFNRSISALWHLPFGNEFVCPLQHWPAGGVSGGQPEIFSDLPVSRSLGVF